MASAERLVFDAEPLVAHAGGEAGSDCVEAALDAVAVGDVTGYVNCVNATEVRYTLVRKSDRATADDYLRWLCDLGITRYGAADVWIQTSEFIIEHNPAMGDAFALATAKALDATLLVGGDSDFDGVEDVPIERFRDGPG